MIILIVHVHVRAESVAAFEAATEDNAVNSRLEPDVVRFDVLRQQDDSTRFVLVEVYKDQHAVGAHKTTLQYLRWREAVAELRGEAMRRARSHCSNSFSGYENSSSSAVLNS